MIVTNKAKIVATIGPASDSKKIMRQLIQKGVNVFRINFSHSTHSEAHKIIKNVKELNHELGTNSAILADLQGPKLRIGTVEEDTVLEVGKKLAITNKECIGNAEQVYITYEQFPRDVKEGEHILLDDGKLLLKVLSSNKNDEVLAEVVQGGMLRSRKGVNLPNTAISLPCLTKKDLKDLDFILKEDVEWIGLSFVRSEDDIMELKQLISDKKSESRVIAKIEKPEAIKSIDAIIKATDGIMVARGDLGVEVPLESVPLIQKEIVDKCHKASKPVIIATQMMESMIDSLRPSRAEVNDVANSVLDGADAMMLSGETSVGNYPVEVVETMNTIIRHTEETGEIRVREEHPPAPKDKRFITDSICYHASGVADQIGAKAILTMTHSGYSAFKISSHRPDSAIIAFTHNRSILNTLSLLWGVKGIYYDKFVSTDDTFKDIIGIVKEKGIVQSGDLIIKIASMPIKEKGMTNTLKIDQIE